MNATTVRKEPSKIKRLGMFVFLTLPGAWLTALCGAELGAREIYHEGAWLPCLLLILLIFGCTLLLCGTRTAEKPLFVLVFVPMPMMIALGCDLASARVYIGFPIGLAGVAMPVIMYRLISRYYRRRTAIAKALEAPSPSSSSPFDHPPST